MNHFFDVGANIGQTFDWFLSKTNEYDGWNVWCFEPSPRHLTKLMEVAKSWTPRFNVLVCPFGLGNVNGSFLFHQKDDPLADSFKPQLYRPGGAEIPDMTVPYTLMGITLTATDFILTHTQSDDRIVMKVDCEGSEFGILQDLLLDRKVISRIQRIYVEWHDLGKSPVDCDNQKDSIKDITNRFLKQGIKLENWPY